MKYKLLFAYPKLFWLNLLYFVVNLVVILILFMFDLIENTFCPFSPCNVIVILILLAFTIDEDPGDEWYAPSEIWFKWVFLTLGITVITLFFNTTPFLLVVRTLLIFITGTYISFRLYSPYKVFMYTNPLKHVNDIIKTSWYCRINDYHDFYKKLLSKHDLETLKSFNDEEKMIYLTHVIKLDEYKWPHEIILKSLTEEK